jgi:hypothetical protein
MNKVIAYKNSLYSIKEGKNVTHRISSVRVDQYDMVNIVVEHGMEVDTLVISMEKAEEIGLINFDVLKEIIK